MVVSCSAADAATWTAHVTGGYGILRLIHTSRPGLLPAPLRLQVQFIFSVVRIL